MTDRLKNIDDALNGLAYADKTIHSSNGKPMDIHDRVNIVFRSQISIMNALKVLLDKARED